MSSYKRIYKHGHPNAKVNGQIFEHVFVMTEMLGRALTDLEVVHHVDEDKMNNSPKNLQLFATQAEHLSHHKCLRAMQECGNPDYRKCPFCGHYDNPEEMVKQRAGGSETYLHKACKDLANAERRSTPEGRAKSATATAASRTKKKLLLTQLEKPNHDNESSD